MRIAILLVVAFVAAGLLMGMTAIGIMGALTSFVTQFMWPLTALGGLWSGWRVWRWWRAREKQKQQQMQGMPSGITFYAPISIANTNTNSNHVGK